MIQRVQSIYLGLISIIYAILFFTPVASVKISGGEFPLYKSFFYGAKNADTGEILHTKGFVLLTVYAILLIILPIVAIFMYRNRPKQIKLTRFTLIINILLVLKLFFYMEGDFQFPKSVPSITYLWESYLTLITVFMLYMAQRAIKKDDDLVKSADRLR